MAVAPREWTTKKGEVHKAYVVRYYDAHGKYRTETFKTRKAAKARDAQIKVDLDKGVHQPHSTAKTVAEAGEFWLETCEAEGVEPLAIDAYRQHLEYHIKPALAPEKRPDAWKGQFGDLKLSRLTGPVCEALRLRVLSSPKHNKRGEIIPGKTISRRTAQHVWTSFKQMLNVAVKHGLPFNPAQKMRLDTKDREKIPIRIGEQIPDRPDVLKIIAASSGIWYALFSLDPFSGLRRSEIRALSWPTVHLDRGEIEVVRRATETDQIGSCKSHAAYRTIQIPDNVVDVLRWWEQICPPSPEELVFPGDDGNVICGTKILMQLYAIQEQIGMVRPNGKLKSDGKLKYPNGKAKYNVHSLRHFYASNMIAAGTDAKRLQELLGHASIETTLDTYGHLFPAGQAERDRANKAFAAVFGSDSNSVCTSSVTEPASARPFVSGATAAAESHDPDRGVAMLRSRPVGTGSPRAFRQQGGATVLPRPPLAKTALTRQSTLGTRTPAPARKEVICIEPGLSGWIITTGTRTLGRYRNYAEAKAAVQKLVSSAPPAD